MADTVMAPVLKLEINLDNAGRWNTEHRDIGKVRHHYQWTPEQWQHIEMSAMRMLLATMAGTAPWGVWEEAIVPEAVDFFEEGGDDLFQEGDEYTNAVATAIGVVDAILSQLEEEVGKRGGSLP
jgi:hypothetical protein